MIIKGQKINDRYQIIRTIGEGGMANVYLAHDVILDRDVAVKILRGDLANDEKFVRRFQREAISSSSLIHPNIVEMYDVGEDDGQYFIVMEYVEGKTLKNLIKRRGALTLSEVIDIMLQLTDGLSCAHDSYIIHRDIKPQNIMILEDGRVKITDFGIAVALNSNELTQTNSVMGSVHYLPPEQANGSGSTIKSDIYSLGILMYELLTGMLPFKGDNAVEIAIKQMRDPIPSVTDFNPEIPQSVENIILKAAAKNPQNRYENVHEMHDDLKTALNVERRQEKKYVYPYPEHEVEEKQPMSRAKKNKEKEERIKEEKTEKRTNKTLIVVSAITGIFVLVIALALLFLPKFGRIPDVEIKDVSGLTVVKAESELKKQGFLIETKVEEEYNDTIQSGLVIKTNPQAGRSVKKGTKLTLIVSLGVEGVEVENYVGKNFYSIEAILKLKGITVNKDEQEFTKKEEATADSILKQSVEKGTRLVKGDSITLTVPKFVTVYPNFVEEKWNVTDVQKFCTDNGISLEIDTKESDVYDDGTIYLQSREAGTKVVKGVVLKITVAKKVTKDTTDTTTDKPSDNSTEKES